MKTQNMDFWVNDPWLYILALILIVSLIFGYMVVFITRPRLGEVHSCILTPTTKTAHFYTLYLSVWLSLFSPYFFNGLRFVVTEWIIHCKNISQKFLGPPWHECI